MEELLRSIRSVHTPSSPAAALRSALLPGWGQLAAGAKVLGAMLLVVDMGLAAGVAIAIAQGPLDLLGLLVRPGTVVWVALGNVVVLAYRTWATWDAWERSGARGRTVVLMLLIALVAIPHVVAGGFHARFALALDRVFTAPSTSVTTKPTMPPSTAQTPDEPSTTTVGVSTTTTPDATEPAPTTVAGPAWGEHLVILLLGGDAGPGRDSVRTDAMLVLAVRSSDGAASLFSLPRNLRGFPFPDGEGFDDILNAVYRFGLEHPDRFGGPDPGATALVGVVEELIGVEVDHHLLVDFEAFRAGVDALGGVTVPVAQQITYPGFRLADGSTVDVVIEPGLRELDGDLALAYVRSRREGTDYGRMERQRCVLAALLDQAEPGRALLSLPSLLGTFEDTVRTDIPRDALGDMIGLLGAVDLDRVGLITFGPPAWHAGWVEGGWPVPDVTRIRKAVADALAGADPLDAGLIPATTSCGLG